MITKQEWLKTMPYLRKETRVVASTQEERNMRRLLWEHNRIALNRISNPNHPYFGRPDEESLVINRQRRNRLRDRFRQNAPEGITN